MAICANCGNVIDDSAKFCENCGAPHMQAVSSASQTGQEQQAQQYSYGSQSQDTSYSAGSGAGYNTGNAYNTGSTYDTGNSYNSGSSYNTGSSYSSGASYGVPNTSGPLPSMSFMEAVQTCFSKYATFSGRARRSEYWWYTLFIFLVQLVLGFVGNLIFGAPKDASSMNILQQIFSLATFCPSLAVFWRRMHDIDKSGAWFFLNLVPCVGSIILLVFACQDSHPGENRFGRSPKYPQ